MEATSSNTEFLNYNDFRSRNIVDKTKGNYTGRLKLFFNWLREQYPMCFRNGDGDGDGDDGELEDGIEEVARFDKGFIHSELNSRMA